MKLTAGLFQKQPDADLDQLQEASNWGSYHDVGTKVLANRFMSRTFIVACGATTCTNWATRPVCGSDGNNKESQDCFAS